jgi:hypothetical protein
VEAEKAVPKDKKEGSNVQNVGESFQLIKPKKYHDGYP